MFTLSKHYRSYNTFVFSLTFLQQLWRVLCTLTNLDSISVKDYDKTYLQRHVVSHQTY